MELFSRNVRGARDVREACLITALCLAFPLTSARSQSPGRHPDRRYVDQSIPVTTTVLLSGPRTVLTTELTLPTARIGREDGPEHSMLGEVAGVATNRSGQVIVVDRKSQDVRLFDMRGAFLQRLGRAGQGPGEFRAPHSVIVTPSDEIWIADMQRRLTVFAPTSDGYKLKRTIPTEIGIRSMCYLNGDLIANGIGLGDPFVVRVLDSLARPIRSFGSLYSSPNAMVNYQFSEGLVTCDATNDLIIYASAAALGEIRAYRRDGRAVWRTVVGDVRANIISDSEGGGLRVERSPEGAHWLISLNLIPGLGVVLQYGFRSPAQMAAKETGSVLTIVIDPQTGKAAVSSVPWPRIAAVTGTQVLAVFEDPVPRLEIRELRRP